MNDDKKCNKFLEKLPIPIKELINDGVYSLYQIENSNDLPPEYLLMTDDNEYYKIDSTGEVVNKIKNIDSYPIKASITFPEIISKYSLKVN